MLENVAVENNSTKGLTDYVRREEYDSLKKERDNLENERDEYRSISLELAETVKVLRDQLKAQGGVVSE